MQQVAPTITWGTSYWREGLSRPVLAKAGVGVKQLDSLRAAIGPITVAFWDFMFTRRFAQSVEPLVDGYMGMRECDRFISEHILPGVPCKLFFDLEFGAKANPDRDVRKDTREMVTALIAIVRTKFPELEEEPCCLYACTPEKGSAHVIFPIVFVDVNHVHDFVLREIVPLVEPNPAFAIKNDKGNVCCAVDTGVYAAGRLFRICGSSKFHDGRSKSNPLLPWEGAFTREQFLQSLLTVVACTEEDIAYVQSREGLRGVCISPLVWSYADKHVARAPKRVRTKHCEPTPLPPPPQKFPIAEGLVDRFVDAFPLLKNQDPRNMTRRPVEFDTALHQHTVTFIIKSSGNANAIICPNKGSAHTNNCIRFYLNITTCLGRFVCMDADCRGKNVWGNVCYKKYMTRN